MTNFTGAPVITVEIDGKPYTGSYLIDGDLLVVYADGHGQDTARRGADGIGWSFTFAAAAYIM